MLLEKEKESATWIEVVLAGIYQCWAGNVHEGLCPLSAVDIMQLLKHDLHLLPIGGALGDKVETLNNTISMKPIPP